MSNNKTTNEQVIEIEVPVSMADTRTTKEFFGPDFLKGTNRIKVFVKWTEHIAGKENYIIASARYQSTYALRGNWPIRLFLDDEKIADKMMTVNQGNTNSPTYSDFITAVKPFTYTGEKTLKIRAELYNFDYTSSSTGQDFGRGVVGGQQEVILTKL